MTPSQLIIARVPTKFASMGKEIVELKVDGMDCNNCAQSIHRYLERKGLEEVFVNFQTKEVRFQRNDTALDLQDAKAGIKKLGYTVIEDTAGQDDHAHANDHANTARRRLIICAIFTAPLLIGHLLMTAGVHLALMHNGWVQLALTLPVYLIGGLHFGRSAWSGVRTGYLNMDVLIFLGATAAFVYSLVGLAWNDPNYYFFETAATIITLVLTGNWLEERAVARTTTAVTALADLQVPRATRIMPSGAEVELDVEELRIGDLVRVNTGDRIPLDGTVLKGEVLVDEAMLTGESLPNERSKGDHVVGGSVLVSGQATVRITATQKEGTLAKMVELVKTAQRDKPSMQRLADRVSAYFVPAVVVISALTFLIGWGTGYATVTQALMNAIAVLLISCPCAMGLATPTAVMVGVGRLARQGILVKGGQAVETLADIRQMVFDKTGTLTTGNFRVEAIEPKGRFSAQTQRPIVNGIIYALEKHSSHPIAKSILNHLENQEKDLTVLNEFQISEKSGVGLTAQNEAGEIVYQLGSARLLPSGHPAAADGQVFLVDGQQQLLATIRLADDLKDGAQAMMAELNRLGITTHLLSGDRQERTAAVASSLGIEHFDAEKLPAEKLDIISSLSAAQPTAMIGDGINDAAALARAQLGISLGGASAAAVDAAQVVLLGDRLTALAEAVKISRLTLKTIKESLFWAFSYNIVAIPLAALGFLNPMWAALFMAFSDVVVIGNAIRLKTRKYQ